MDVKEAVKMAMEQFMDIFQSEPIENVALEEVVFNSEDNVWEVTIGFSRPWDYPKNNSLVANLRTERPIRSYKVITIDDESGIVKSIKIRSPRNA